MWLALRTAVVLSALLGLSPGQQQTTVQRTDGTTASGRIEGVLVLRGRPAGAAGTVKYTLIDGEDVTSIGADGIRTRPNRFTVILVKAANPADTAILEGITSLSRRDPWNPGAVAFQQTDDSPVVVAPVDVRGTGTRARLEVDYGDFRREDVLRIAGDFGGAEAVSTITGTLEEVAAMSAALGEGSWQDSSAVITWTDRLLGEADKGELRLSPRVRLVNGAQATVVPVGRIARPRARR